MNTDELLAELEAAGKIPDIPESDIFIDFPPSFKPRSLHFDREGRPITMAQWCALHNVLEYIRIDSTYVGGYHASTVWVGLDMGYGFLHGGPPLVFETMVFEAEATYASRKEIELLGKQVEMGGFWYHRSYDQMRYATEEQARAGHAKMVAEIEATIAAAPDPRDLPLHPKEDDLG